MSPLFKKSYFAALIYLLLELLLAGLERVTANRDFSTFANDVIEIDIFRGSAVAGHQSETSFMELLHWELEQEHPGQKFIFENFARAGYSFHKVEAKNSNKLSTDMTYSSSSRALTKPRNTLTR